MRKSCGCSGKQILLSAIDGSRYFFRDELVYTNSPWTEGDDMLITVIRNSPGIRLDLHTVLMGGTI